MCSKLSGLTVDSICIQIKLQPCRHCFLKEVMHMYNVYDKEMILDA